MNKKDFNTRTKIIRETFDDKRAIKCPTPENVRQLDENVYPGGDILTTEDGEYIDFEFQLEDFTVEELVKYVELAEALYEKNNKKNLLHSISLIGNNDLYRMSILWGKGFIR